MKPISNENELFLFYVKKKDVSSLDYIKVLMSDPDFSKHITEESRLVSKIILGNKNYKNYVLNEKNVHHKNDERSLYYSSFREALNVFDEYYTSKKDYSSADYKSDAIKNDLYLALIKDFRNYPDCENKIKSTGDADITSFDFVGIHAKNLVHVKQEIKDVLFIERVSISDKKLEQLITLRAKEVINNYKKYEKLVNKTLEKDNDIAKEKSFSKRETIEIRNKMFKSRCYDSLYFKTLG